MTNCCNFFSIFSAIVQFSLMGLIVIETYFFRINLSFYFVTNYFSLHHHCYFSLLIQLTFFFKIIFFLLIYLLNMSLLLIYWFLCFCCLKLLLWPSVSYHCDCNCWYFYLPLFNSNWIFFCNHSNTITLELLSVEGFAIVAV